MRATSSYLRADRFFLAAGLLYGLVFLVERAGFRHPGVLLAAFSLLLFGISVWALVTRFYAA